MGRNRFHFHTEILIEAIDVDTVVRHLTANGCIEFYKLRKTVFFVLVLHAFQPMYAPPPPHTHI